MKLVEGGRFAIKKSMPGVGMGLFAVKPIKRGERVLEYTGNRIPTKEANESDSRYLFEINRNWTIDGPVPANLAGYVNHSCDPNTEAEIEDGHIFYVAVSDITSGEELTIDYGEEYFDEFIKPVGCKCAHCLNPKRRARS